jgi:hypothetical protein
MVQVSEAGRGRCIVEGNRNYVNPIRDRQPGDLSATFFRTQVDIHQEFARKDAPPARVGC